MHVVSTIQLLNLDFVADFSTTLHKERLCMCGVNYVVSLLSPTLPHLHSLVISLNHSGVTAV